MLRLRFNIIIIIILVFVYSAEKLTLLRDEVVDTSKFVEYYSMNKDESGDEILESNSFVIEREYILVDGEIPVSEPIPVTEPTEPTGPKLKPELTRRQIEEARKKQEEEAKIKAEEEAKKKQEEEQRKKLRQVNEYTVKKGDTLNKISEKHKIPEDIIRHYNPKMSKALKEGEVLKIPADNFIKYRVIKGDNVARVAQKHYVKEVDIIEYNALGKSAMIKVGQELLIKDPDIKKMNIAEKNEKIKKEKAKEAAKSKFSMPIKYSGVSSPFGVRRHPVLKRFIMHTGVDFRAKYIPVKAAQEGTISYAGYKSGYGKIIIITHRNGYETRYAHLNNINVRVGEKVARDKVIGKTGNTGRSTGPHLHFEIRKNDKPLNPMNFVK